MNDEKRYLAVVSGGMDSITMLHDKQNNIDCVVSFNYGSNHNENEINCAAAHCKLIDKKHIIIDMREAFKPFKSALLSGAEAIPEGHYEDETMKHTVVPFRNGIMLSVAAGLAESEGMDGIMLASHAGDHAVYPDCRPDFDNAICEAIYEGTATNISVVFPYAGITKREIAHKGAELLIEWESTWSCYKGGAHHCGRCSTCVERIWALKGLEDHTVYEDTQYAKELLIVRGEW